MVSKIKIVGLLLCMSFCKLSFAVPMFIQFNEMMKRTSCIAIGTFLGFDGKTADESFVYYFKVDQYLKTPLDKSSSDTLKLSRASGAAYLQPGTKCVAFINENGGFEWYGVTKNSIISDQSILFIEGFYDWNAYIVSPAILSVGQLKEYIELGSYHGSVYGDIHFFSNTTKQMEASNMHVEVTYTYHGDDGSHIYKTNSMEYNVEINGIDLNDFKNKPTFGLPWHYEEVTIEYQPNLSRPLEFKGKILNIHPSDSRMHCYFWVEEPEELTYDEFTDFINDPHKGHAYYELEVTLGDSKTYKVLVGDEIGQGGKLLGYDKEPIPMSSLSLAPKREIVFDDGEKTITITLDSTRVDKAVLEFSGKEFIRELKINPVNGIVQLKKSDASWTTLLGSCTVTYKATHFGKY